MTLRVLGPVPGQLVIKTASTRYSRAIESSVICFAVSGEIMRERKTKFKVVSLLLTVVLGVAPARSAHLAGLDLPINQSTNKAKN